MKKYLISGFIFFLISGCMTQQKIEEMKKPDREAHTINLPQGSTAIKTCTFDAWPYSDEKIGSAEITIQDAVLTGITALSLSKPVVVENRDVQYSINLSADPSAKIAERKILMSLTYKLLDKKVRDNKDNRDAARDRENSR